MANETPDLSGMIGSLLSDPGIMSKISGIASEINGGGTKIYEENETRKTDEREDVKSPDDGKAQNGFESLDSLLGPLLKDRKRPGKSETDKRNALLKALKPYLSREKGEAIDYFIKLGGIGETLRAINAKK